MTAVKSRIFRILTISLINNNSNQTHYTFSFAKIKPTEQINGFSNIYCTLAANEATVGFDIGAGAATAVVVVVTVWAPAVGSGAGAADVVTGVKLRVVTGPCGLFGGS